MWRRAEDGLTSLGPCSWSPAAEALLEAGLKPCPDHLEAPEFRTAHGWRRPGFPDGLPPLGPRGWRQGSIKAGRIIYRAPKPGRSWKQERKGARIIKKRGGGLDAKKWSEIDEGQTLEVDGEKHNNCCLALALGRAALGRDASKAAVRS